MMKNPFKVLIIICWILLILCCVAKLFGANWFIASTDNQRFIDVCNYIDETKWLRFILRMSLNIFSCSLYYMAILKEKKLTLNSLKWLIPLVIYATLKNIFSDMLTLFIILDFIMMLGLPILIKRDKETIIWTIVGCVLTTLFQLISMWLKLDKYSRFDEVTLVNLILNIDYYIMMILFWLYRIRKVVEHND